MRVIFAGTPVFAAQALQALVDAGHEIPLVLTQPDRPAGRGMSLQASPVKKLALDLGLQVSQPLNFKSVADQCLVQQQGADVMVVAAYGLILPQVVLDMPTFGCINIHASLLPRWRGAAPIQRAILAGDTQTGVCIMQMEAGLDTGPVLAKGEVAISPSDSAQSLHDKLATLGATLIADVLPKLPMTASPQALEGVTYAAKLEKAEAEIDWTHPAEIVDRQVRAFNPVPGAFCRQGDGVLKIWAAEFVDLNGEPGTILSVDRKELVVACGRGALRLLEVQKAGSKRVSIGQYLAGSQWIKGQCFG